MKQNTLDSRQGAGLVCGIGCKWRYEQNGMRFNPAKNEVNEEGLEIWPNGSLVSDSPEGADRENHIKDLTPPETTEPPKTALEPDVETPAGIVEETPLIIAAQKDAPKLILIDTNLNNYTSIAEMRAALDKVGVPHSPMNNRPQLKRKLQAILDKQQEGAV